ncbi:beta-1,3-galactosyltransferase 4-like [Rhinophrynus dorsalis]
MIPLTAVCLRCFHLPRRRCSFLALFSILLLVISLVLTGHVQEIISHALPLFYPLPSSVPAFSHNIPPFLISPPKACTPPPFLLILVSTAPSHRDQRNAIRQTWGSLSSSVDSGSLTLFVLGFPTSQDGQVALVQEANFHGDIIQAAFTDSYWNLTLKTLVGMAWASQKCQGAHYLMKTDDDVFVNTESLSKFLQAQKGPLYLGQLHWRVSPQRDPENRHYTSYDLYNADHFPPYCSGMGYVLSLGVVMRLLQEAGRVPVITSEDVYVGLLAWAAGISPRHSARVGGAMALPHNGCCYKAMFNLHGLTPQGMRVAWNMLNEAKARWCPLALLQCKILWQLLENGEMG